MQLSWLFPQQLRKLEFRNARDFAHKKDRSRIPRRASLLQILGHFRIPTEPLGRGRTRTGREDEDDGRHERVPCARSPRRWLELLGQNVFR